MPPIAVFPVAFAAAGLMGFANQRGGTCMVAAVEQIVLKRRFGRMLALLEASLWVCMGFVLLSAAGRLRDVPPDYALSLATVAGGVLFGLGAAINGSCLFGTVARLGSGQWAYAATPLGLFLGSFAARRLRFAEETHAASLVLGASALGAVAALAFVALRLGLRSTAIRRARRPVLAELWTPRAATTLIGLAFLVAFLTAGAWDYADLLRDLARGVMEGWLPKALLTLALLLGAVLGGWTSGQFKSVAPQPIRICSCLAGGGLMGVGEVLIPGGNSSLTLLGLPLLRPYAWLGFATIALTIYAAVQLTGLREEIRRRLAR